MGLPGKTCTLVAPSKTALQEILSDETRTQARRRQPHGRSRFRRLCPERRDGQDRPDRRPVRPVRQRRPEPAAHLAARRPTHFSGAKNPAGVNFEIVGMDSKSSPQEALNLLKSAADQGIPLRHAGQRLERRACRWPTPSPSTTSATPARRSSTSTTRRSIPALTNEQVHLLALPPRRRHVDEDGGAHRLHEGPAEGHQEGLPDQPELLARPAGRQVLQGRPGAQPPRRQDRRRRPAPARPGEGLRAVRRQDQAVGRRHHRHRQLGSGHDAADQGAATTPA